MTLTQFPDLQKLPKRQKLKLAEELWFAAVDDSAPVSADHQTPNKAPEPRRDSSRLVLWNVPSK
jgi:hypothetical protein